MKALMQPKEDMNMDNSAITGLASAAMANEKELFGAKLVAKTLNTLNQGGPGSMGPQSTNPDYEFQKDVLSAGLMNKGAITNKKA